MTRRPCADGTVAAFGLTAGVTDDELAFRERQAPPVTVGERHERDCAEVRPTAASASGCRGRQRGRAATAHFPSGHEPMPSTPVNTIAMAMARFMVNHREIQTPVWLRFLGLWCHLRGPRPHSPKRS